MDHSNPASLAPLDAMLEACGAHDFTFDANQPQVINEQPFGELWASSQPPSDHATTFNTTYMGRSLQANGQPDFQKQFNINRASYRPGPSIQMGTSSSDHHQSNQQQVNRLPADSLPMQNEFTPLPASSYNQAAHALVDMPTTNIPQHSSHDIGQMNLNWGLQPANGPYNFQPPIDHQRNTPHTVRRQPTAHQVTPEERPLQNLAREIRARLTPDQESQIMTHVGQLPLNRTLEIQDRSIDPVALHCYNRAKHILRKHSASQMAPQLDPQPVYTPVQEHPTAHFPTNGTKEAPILLDNEGTTAPNPISPVVPSPESTTNSPKPKFIDITDKIYGKSPPPEKEDFTYTAFCDMGWMATQHSLFGFNKTARTHRFYVKEDDPESWYCIRVNDGTKMFRWQVESEIEAHVASQQKAKRNAEWLLEQKRAKRKAEEELAQKPTKCRRTKHQRREERVQKVIEMKEANQKNERNREESKDGENREEEETEENETSNLVEECENMLDALVDKESEDPQLEQTADSDTNLNFLFEEKEENEGIQEEGGNGEDRENEISNKIGGYEEALEDEDTSDAVVGDESEQEDEMAEMEARGYDDDSESEESEEE